MATYFNAMFNAFFYGSLVLGALLLVLLVALGILWCATKIHNVMPLARGVELAIAVRVNGSRYNERVFWKALHERAATNEFAAKEIIRNAAEHLPPNARGKRRRSGRSPRRAPTRAAGWRPLDRIVRTYLK